MDIRTFFCGKAACLAVSLFWAGSAVAQSADQSWQQPSHARQQPDPVLREPGPLAAGHREPQPFSPQPQGFLPPPAQDVSAIAGSTPAATSSHGGYAVRAAAHQQLATAPAVVDSNPAPAFHPASAGNPTSPVSQAAAVSRRSTAADGVATASAPPPSGGAIPLPPPSKSSAGSRPRTGAVWQSLTTTLAALMLVVGLVAILAAVAKRAGRPTGGQLPKEVFTVLGRSSFAPRQQVVVMQFGGKLLLVAGEAGSVRTLAEIDSPAEVDRIVGMCEQHSPGSVSASFHHILQAVIGGDSGRSAAVPAVRKQGRSSARGPAPPPFAGGSS